MAISASARWAMISETDHFPGAGRRVSCFLVLPRSSAASFLGVVCCKRRGSCPSLFFRIRCVYCCGLSCIVSLQRCLCKEADRLDDHDHPMSGQGGWSQKKWKAEDPANA